MDDIHRASSGNWEVQLRKGSLELAILAALWHGELYGLEILRLLKKNSALVVAEGSVYPVLSRLKAESLVASQWVEAEGHPRKYFQLTPGGRRRAREMARIWADFSRTLNGLLSPLLEEEQ